MATETTTTPVSTQPRLITADELLQHSSDFPRGELIRGVFCEMPPPGVEHNEVIMSLSASLYNVVKANKLGRVLPGDTGVRVERDPDTVRAPDIAFFTAERMPLDDRIPGHAEIVPDIAVEVVSPNDRVTAVNDKARMWIEAGVKLVWVAWPDRQTIEVHRPGDQSVVELSGEQTLDGEDVLPGFSVPITEIFGG